MTPYFCTKVWALHVPVVILGTQIAVVTKSYLIELVTAFRRDYGKPLDIVVCGKSGICLDQWAVWLESEDLPGPRPAPGLCVELGELPRVLESSVESTRSSRFRGFLQRVSHASSSSARPAMMPITTRPIRISWSAMRGVYHADGELSRSGVGERTFTPSPSAYRKK